jgi:F-type H+-transporting ATPase subunit b
MLHLFAAEAVDAGNPILPPPPDLLWGAITFGLLFVLVRFVFLPPVQQVMNDREATIQADRDAADAAKAKMASADAEHADQLAGVMAEAESIIDEARTEGEAERSRLIARAEREVAAMFEVAESDIASERDEAMAVLRPQVADLAVGAASKVMNRQVSLDSAQSVVNRALDSTN